MTPKIIDYGCISASTADCDNPADLLTEMVASATSDYGWQPLGAPVAYQDKHGEAVLVQAVVLYAQEQVPA